MTSPFLSAIPAAQAEHTPVSDSHRNLPGAPEPDENSQLLYSRGGMDTLSSTHNGSAKNNRSLSLQLIDEITKTHT